MAAVIDYEVGLFDKSEIAGAYRSICAMLLLRTATVVRKRTRYRNMETQQKAAARRWVESENEGAITFREACAAIDIEPNQMRKDILALVRSEPSNAIIKKKPAFVFGRQFNEPSCETETVG